LITEINVICINDEHIIQGGLLKRILILGILIILLINSCLTCSYGDYSGSDTELYKPVPGSSGERVTPEDLLEDAEYCRDRWIKAKASGDEKSAKFWHEEMMKSMNEYYLLIEREGD
jgi:hypothetical protein